MERRLLPLGDPKFGVGQQLTVADRFQRSVRRVRNGEADQSAVDPSQVVDRAGRQRARFAAGVRRHRLDDAGTGRAVSIDDEAEVAVLAQIDLQELDVDDHFRLGFVVGLNDLLSDAHFVRCVADGDGIERFEGKDVSGLNHGPDDVGDLLGVAVGEVEGADDEVFVVAASLRVVRDDDDGRRELCRSDSRPASRAPGPAGP